MNPSFTASPGSSNRAFVLTLTALHPRPRTRCLNSAFVSLHQQPKSETSAELMGALGPRMNAGMAVPAPPGCTGTAWAGVAAGVGTIFSESNQIQVARLRIQRQRLGSRRSGYCLFHRKIRRRIFRLITVGSVPSPCELNTSIVAGLNVAPSHPTPIGRSSDDVPVPSPTKSPCSCCLGRPQTEFCFSHRELAPRNRRPCSKRHTCPPSSLRLHQSPRSPTCLQYPRRFLPCPSL